MIRYIEKLVSWIEDLFGPPGGGRSDVAKGTDSHPSTTSSTTLQRKILLSLRQGFFILKRRRGLVLRGLICWMIGLLALHLDEVSSYDFRLALRGDQDRSEKIMIIDISEADLNQFATHRNTFMNLKDDTTRSSESRFWHLPFWREVLTHVLSKDPSGIGINFFFDERVGRDLSPVDWNLFTDKKIMWMGSISQESVVQLPPFTDKQKQNFGFGEFLRDEDGMLRSIGLFNPHYPPIALRLAEFLRPDAKDLYPNGRGVINFRGSGRSFEHVSATDLLEGNVPAESMRGKVVIIGAASNSSTTFASPVGPLSRSEVLAHEVDNLVNNRWIQRLPRFLAFTELFLVMLISVFVMNFYPQKVAFVFLSFLALALASLSIWFFDIFYYWTPAFSPIIQITGTWTLFVGYLASRMEQKNWQLEQERKTLAQLEQLKNNFVSLISHDLKTPIAKIQAIVDRLLTSEHSPDLIQDLKSLRGSSHELNRYIQSILKILRVESRDFHLNIEVADINELLQKAVLQHQPLAREKNITLTQNLEPLFSVEVDGTLIQEVLGNILENAIKYTPQGGQVWIETRETDQAIQIRIRDNGEGIAPNEIEEVFGKFVRGRNQDLKSKGSGLGLYLVKYFIELHGGRVSLSSEVGKGTTVDLYLPTEG